MQMRKAGLFWALVLVGAAAAPLSAQTAVGMRAGFRRATLQAVGASGGLSSAVVGGYFGIGLSDHVALQVEAVYGTRGTASVQIGAGQLDSAAPASRLQMRYLDLPVLIRTAFPGERLMPSFFVGPYVGFLLGCELKPPGETSRSCDAATSDGTAATEGFSPRSTDYGLVVGGALDLLMGRHTVFLDVRYNVGLMSIQAGNDPMDARHNGLDITAGLAFPLGG